MLKPIKAGIWAFLGIIGLMFMMYYLVTPGEQPLEAGISGFMLSIWAMWTYSLLDKND